METRSAKLRTLRSFSQQVIRESMDDGVLDLAAAVSYYFLFALFPALLFLAALLAQLHLTGLMENIVATLTAQLPRDAGQMVSMQVQRLLQNHSSGLISLSTILLLYSASQGFTGLMSAFNRAYEVPETRSWWKRLLIAIELTFSAGLLIAIALSALIFGEKLLFFITGPFHIGPALAVFWPVLRWGAIMVFLWLAMTMLYHYLPNIRGGNSGMLTAAFASLVLWTIASALLASYADNIATYSAIYGSLGAVIALMLWFYVLALALLVGAEIHSEILRRQGISCHPGDSPVTEEPHRRKAA